MFTIEEWKEMSDKDKNKLVMKQILKFLAVKTAMWVSIYALSGVLARMIDKKFPVDPS